MYRHEGPWIVTHRMKIWSCFLLVIKTTFSRCLWIQSVCHITRSGVTLDLRIRTSIQVALAILRTPYVDRVYRENPDMGWHIFTFRRWFDRAVQFAVRGGQNEHLWYFWNHYGHSGSGWASSIPFQNKRIDSPRIKVACFSSFYVKIQTVRNKKKIVSIGKYIGVSPIFARKDSLFAFWDIVSFVTQFVEGISERTLIEGRRCTTDVRYSFNLKCSILKGLH